MLKSIAIVSILPQSGCENGAADVMGGAEVGTGTLSMSTLAYIRKVNGDKRDAKLRGDERCWGWGRDVDIDEGEIYPHCWEP